MSKGKAIHETVATALLDAVVVGPVLVTGGFDRSAVETADAVSSVSNNLAVERYRVDHPDEELDDDAWIAAIRDGRALLAMDGVEWLLEKGYLREVEGGGLITGKPYRVRAEKGKTKPYVPGTHREEDLFRNLRRVNPKRLALLRESIETLGDLRDAFPVLEDEDGNLVDGRHRRAYDPEWPAIRRKVPRRDRLATAVAANRTNAWTTEDWARLATHAEFVTGRKVAARELARLALLNNHARPNREIANALGCAEDTVWRARRELEETHRIDEFRAPDGRPRKDGTPAQPSPRKDPKVRAAVREAMDSEVLSVEELADRLEISTGLVKQIRGEVEVEIETEERVRAELSELVEPDLIAELGTEPVPAFPAGTCLVAGSSPCELAERIRRYWTPDQIAELRELLA